MDDVVNGIRYRLPLKTTNWQEAKRLEKEKLAEIAEGKAGAQGPAARRSFNLAMNAYLEERKLHKSTSTYTTDFFRAKPLRAFFGESPLRRITADCVVKFQALRAESMASGRTINMEIGLLRRVMKRNKQWLRIAEDVVNLPEEPKPARVLTVKEKREFLALAASKPDWEIAYHASVVALNTTMRACEIRGIRVSDVSLFDRTLTVKRQSRKTDAGARVIPLTSAAVISLSKMFERIQLLSGELKPEYFVFPACEHGNVDATRPMRSWRSAWHGLTKAAGLKGFRFHDLRHQAIAELAELGLSDQTIMSIAGHVSKEMLNHYSHIRMAAKRKALDSMEAEWVKDSQVTPAEASGRLN